VSLQLNIPYQVILIIIPGLFISGVLVGGNWSYLDSLSIFLFGIGIAGAIGFTVFCLFRLESEHC
jgi:hypothetical protein